MNQAAESPGTLTFAAFAVGVIIGGANFVAVRFSNEELEPFWGAGLRFALAAVVFIAIVTVLRLRWPKGRLLWLTSLYGLFAFSLSYALMYWALVQVTAGIAAVVLAIVPLITPLLAAFHKLEPLNRRALMGAVVALAGIVLMTVGPEGLVLPLSGLIAILIAAFTIGESVILSKMVSENHPAMTNAVAMAVGTPFLLVASLVAGETWAIPQGAKSLWSVLYLVLIGSVGLFVLILIVVRRWTASATAYMFVLFPVVAMLLEAWLDDVPLTVRGVVGALVVMAGVWFGALAPAASGRNGRNHGQRLNSPAITKM